MITDSLLARTGDAIAADLRRNILPFWAERVADRTTGTFLGSLTNDLVADRTAERGALLTTRILWTFAAAGRTEHEPAWLEVADLAQADLMTRFHDGRDGGFFWSVAADGTVRQDRKQVYGQAFALYALAEYHAATGRRAPLDHAIATFRLLERHARDRQHGGYFEAFARDWSPIADVRLSDIDQNDPKSQNTMLHVMEAYTNLRRVWPDPDLHAALTELVGVMLDRVVDAATAHLRLFFAEDWTPRSDRISYGHDIEAAWLLTEAAAVLGDPALLARTRQLAVRIAEATLAEGVDADGGVFNLGSPAGLVDTNKEWWPQAEAVVGFLQAHEISGDDRHLAAALHTWDFIARHLIDRVHGEWFRGVTRDGTVIAGLAKVSFWKCPYHNGRMALEAGRRLRSIRAARAPSPAP